MVHQPFQDRFFFPLTVKLLYLIPMSLGSDMAPRLLHLASGALAVGAVAALAQRAYGGHAGGFGALAAGTVPLLDVIAGWAYIDLTWSLFQTLAVLAVFRWWDGAADRWLVVGGLLLGLSLGSKYLALQAAMAALRRCSSGAPCGGPTASGASRCWSSRSGCRPCW